VRFLNQNKKHMHQDRSENAPSTGTSFRVNDRKNSVFAFVLLTISVLVFAQTARADSLKDFLLTCTYGTLTGAVLGAASLAFVDDPTLQMGNIAKGASLGLYAGMAWGAVKAYRNPANYSPAGGVDLGMLAPTPSTPHSQSDSWALAWTPPGFTTPGSEDFGRAFPLPARARNWEMILSFSF
jgi:hypothetical protein